MEKQEILKILNVSKSFFGVRVLKDVSLTLNKGETHKLMVR